MKPRTWILPLLLALITAIGITQPYAGIGEQADPKPLLLLYNHIVPSNDQYPTFNERYSYVTTKAFDQQLWLLKKRGYRFINRVQYNDIIRGDTKDPGRTVVILFRDGYADIADNALPLLNRYQVPAIVFNRPANTDQPGFLTTDQIKQMEAQGSLVIPPNFSIIANPAKRQEVSGVIKNAQFEDLLQTQQHNSTRFSLGIAALVFCLGLLTAFSPTLALLLPIVSLPTYLIRFTIFGIPFTMLEVILLTVIVCLGVKNLRRIVAFIVSQPYALPALLLVIGGIISTIFAQDKIAALGGLKAYLLEPIAFAIILGYYHKKQSLVFPVLWAFLLSSLIVAISSLSRYAAGDGYVTQALERLTTYFGNPNYLASFLTVGLLSSVYLFLTLKRRLLRLISGLSFVIIGISFSLTKSDTATLGVLAALAFIAVHYLPLRMPGRSKMPALVCSLAIIIPFLIFLMIGTPQGLAFLKQAHLETLVSRHYIYQASFSIIQSHFVTGLGFLNYNQAFITYVSPMSPEKNVALSHNTLLDFWTQLGFFGLVGYCWLVIRFFRIGLLAKNREAMIVTALMLVFIVHGMLDSQYHKNDYSVIFWILIALQDSNVKFKKKNEK